MLQWDLNFAHAMTAQLSWHVQNWDLIGASSLMLEQPVIFQNLGHKLKNLFWNGSLAMQIQNRYGMNMKHI